METIKDTKSRSLFIIEIRLLILVFLLLLLLLFWNDLLSPKTRTEYPTSENLTEYLRSSDGSGITQGP